jgi:hypothetical protein
MEWNLVCWTLNLLPVVSLQDWLSQPLKKERISSYAEQRKYLKKDFLGFGMYI